MSFHRPVMVDEIIEFLRAKDGGCFFDGTFGQGGHSKAILLANKNNIVYATDRDPSMIEFANALKQKFKNRFFFVSCSFKDSFRYFNMSSISGFLLDLGLNQGQLYSKNRGFSFYDDESLDCRINPKEHIPTGREIINNCSTRELSRILSKGGVGKELPFVLRAIIKHRPFNSAKELGDAILRNLPQYLKNKGKKSFRHVVLQALRIAVNKEEDHLREFLENLKSIAKPFSRAVIVCFHSLEDKIVTSIFRSWNREKIGVLLTKKSIKPSSHEVETNPSARSALLRVFQFYGESN